MSLSDVFAIVDKHNALRSDPMARRNARAMCKIVSSNAFSNSIKIPETAKVLNKALTDW